MASKSPKKPAPAKPPGRHPMYSDASVIDVLVTAEKRLADRDEHSVGDALLIIRHARRLLSTRKSDREFGNWQTAKLPRSKVTAKALTEYHQQFKVDHKGKDRGWRTAACLEFGITLKTIKEKMRE